MSLNEEDDIENENELENENENENDLDELDNQEEIDENDDIELDDDEEDQDDDGDLDDLNNLEEGENEMIFSNQYQEDSSDDEYDSDDYNEKFDQELTNKYIIDTHPELNEKNASEIEFLTRIHRDENNNIIDENHKTFPVLTKYEKTKVLGIRVKQLNNGSNPFITIASNVFDNKLIAIEELKKKKLPFIIIRTIGKSKVEYWDVNDLELLD